METAASDDRAASTLMVGRALRYVGRLLGDEGATAVLERAGLGARAAEVTAEGGWCTLDELAGVFAAAADVCGDPQLGRRVGEEHLREQHFDGTVDFYRELGSVEAVLPLTIDFANKLSIETVLVLTGVGEGWAEIDVSGTDGSPVGERYAFACGLTAGFFGSLPAVFGSFGAAAERTCRHRGDDRCRFRVVWDSPGSRGTTTTNAGVVAGAIERYERLQVLGADLAGSEDVDTVLTRALEHAGTTVLARRVLVAVQVPGEHHPRVRHVGDDDAHAEAVAADLLAGRVPDEPEAIHVPLPGRDRCVGHLLAVLPSGSTPEEHERRALRSFAHHVGAAIEGVHTLAEARRNHATSEALLGLARALATATADEDVADHLVTATTAAVGADLVGVWLAGDDDTITAVASLPADVPWAGATRRRTDAPEFAMALALDPLVIEARTASDRLRAAMAITGAHTLVAMPIVAHDAFLGTLVAGYADVPPPPTDDAFLDRLRGLADQAGAALQNARLVEAVRHQSLHDDLTGLPTRRLMEDRTRQALAQARRSGATLGLLFLDLDRFKEVNDTLGHAAGDELIRGVGERLVRCVRSADTVARQGGDELVVLLPNLPRRRDAEVAALKIMREMGRPFVVAGQELTISASIGVATDTGGRTPYDDLLHRADLAMYEAKAQGRNTVAVYRERHLDPSAFLTTPESR